MIYICKLQSGLHKLEELVTNINDIIENRIEKNLKIVSKTLLVELPDADAFTVEDFVKMQEKHILKQVSLATLPQTCHNLTRNFSQLNTHLSQLYPKPVMT